MSFELLIYAAVAVFLIFRLFSVLGKRTGHEERPPFPPTQEREKLDAPENDKPEDENVVRLPTAFDEPVEESAQLKGPAGDGLRKVQAADGAFDPDEFLGGARMAFEMIVTAYAEGDRKTLKDLLDKPTYESFAGAIDAREKEGHRMEDTLVGIDAADVAEAFMDKDVARVTVRFVSQQVNVTYDAEGRVLDGDPTSIETVSDLWTFARSVKSRNPNWQLVETRVAD